MGSETFVSQPLYSTLDTNIELDRLARVFSTQFSAKERIFTTKMVDDILHTKAVVSDF